METRLSNIRRNASGKAVASGKTAISLRPKPRTIKKNAANNRLGGKEVGTKKQFKALLKMETVLGMLYMNIGVRIRLRSWNIHSRQR